MGCVGILFYAGYMQNKRLTVDPETYAPLLHLIARAESNNNDNAYFGNPGNTSIDFTAMTISEVLAWQTAHVQKGNASSAVGRYQIVNTTLAELVRQQAIDTERKFDKNTQDSLALVLLERRGGERYINQEITREQFAANIAMEWAALPKTLGDNPNNSYYAGDGLNQARVKVDEVLRAIELIKAK